MNRHFLTIALLPLCMAMSCSLKKPANELSFIIFNEGVRLSLAALDAADKGDMEQALKLNHQAIEKFRTTIAIDSTHAGAVSALAHSLYLNHDYREAIDQFNRAIPLQPDFSISYQERGLCKINLGQIAAGRQDIDHAIALDSSRELLENTVLDLHDIGKLAFKYGYDYASQRDSAKGQTYKKFSIDVLLAAFDLDTTNRETARLITEHALKMGDTTLTAKYQHLFR